MVLLNSSFQIAPNRLERNSTPSSGAREFREHPSFYLTYWWARNAFIHATKNGIVLCCIQIFRPR